MKQACLFILTYEYTFLKSIQTAMLTFLGKEIITAIVEIWANDTEGVVISNMCFWTTGDQLTGLFKVVCPFVLALLVLCTYCHIYCLFNILF